VGSIRTLEALRAIVGEPSPQAPLKLHEQINARAAAFVARSPLLLLSTADGTGQPTVSPKGDGPGFARVADPGTLLIPERKGNKLLFSLQNVLANPRVGLIFLVPGTSETLRIGGEAELLDDAQLCEAFTARGRPALLVMRVRVTQCYFHCAKAFLRSELWKPETWPAEIAVSFGAEIAEAGALSRESIETFDAGVHERYRTDL
jgi:uncharacterized protein